MLKDKKLLTINYLELLKKYDAILYNFAKLKHV